MNSWKVWFATPQPLRTFYILWFPCLIFAVVYGSFGSGNERWMLFPSGIDGVLLGATLAFNINGAATAVAKIMAEQRPMGIDYSQSFFASAANARFVGVGFTLICGFMCVTPLL